jgi:uncharacterized membrane protein YuzA (DUF378 family)
VQSQLSKKQTNTITWNPRPSLLNAIVGLISTLINVYAAQHGEWSVTARITAIMTGFCTGMNLVLFLVYNNWLLYQVKKDHDQVKKDHEMGPSKGNNAESFGTLANGS